MADQTPETLVVRRLLNLIELEDGARVGTFGDSTDAPRPALVAAIAQRGGVALDAPPPLGDLGAPAEPLDALILSGVSWPSPLVGEELIAALSSVRSDGTVVFVLPEDAPTTQHAKEMANVLGPIFDLQNIHAVTDGVLTLVRGRRRAKLDNATRKRLRGLAHDIEPTVLIGRSGLTPEVVETARQAVERHGLIKAKLTPQCKLDKAAIARDIAWATGSQLVQRIGKTAVLYRPDVTLEPPQRRTGRRRHR